MKNKSFFNSYFFSLLGLILVLIFFSIQHLSLPYYWDESWVYGPGTRQMAINGPSLFPTSLPIEISRGHPLAFYFLTALWLKIFGNTVFSSHVFSLVISIALVIAVYKLCARFFSERVGIFCSAILMVQAIFLAQSCMVLPEVMLSLWVIASIGAFYAGKKPAYLLFATLMLLTKETGLMCIVAIFFNELLFDWFGNSESKNQSRFVRPFINYKKYLVIFIPVLIASIHFLIQKKIYGWFFFPEHINYISFKWNDIVRKFRGYFSYSFIYYGRNSLLFGGIICGIISIIRKKKGSLSALSLLEKQVLLCLGLYLFYFISFSSINFYSDRYVMSIIAPFIIITVYFIDRALTKLILKWIAIVGIICTGIFYSCTQLTNSDHNLGYVNAVKTYNDCVGYCVSVNLKEEVIYTNYLMEYALADTLSGYVNEQNKFSNVSSHFNSSTQLCIFSNVETCPMNDSIRKNVSLKLMKEFKNGKAIIEIYKVEKDERAK